jgi:hypothetical protein
MSVPAKLVDVTVAGMTITQIVHTLDYFESIYSPCASCNIAVNDAAGFVHDKGLKGGEDVEIEFGSSAGGENIKMKFKTIIIGDRMRVKENQDLMNLTAAL